jgi:hypothetical protein
MIAALVLLPARGLQLPHLQRELLHSDRNNGRCRMGPQRISPTVFEFRLEGGVSFGFGPPRAGDGGMARILSAPDFCSDPKLARYFDQQVTAQWGLAPIDSTTRQEFADIASLVRPVDVDAVTKGVGFIHLSGGHQCVFAELRLPVDKFAVTGLSTFEDWLRILRATKDDLNQEAVLRLTFAPDRLQDADIAAFKIGKRISTTDVELQVRPRLVQWRSAD